jgi:hypothetical protein
MQVNLFLKHGNWPNSSTKPPSFDEAERVNKYQAGGIDTEKLVQEYANKTSQATSMKAS